MNHVFLTIINYWQVVKDFFNDARHFQIIYLGSFLIFGIAFLQWENSFVKFGLTVGSAILTQLVFSYFTTKNYVSWKSALITSLGLCLLFKANVLPTVLIASFIAIASKFLIRIKNKHVFNPVNFGIVMGILLTGDAWVSPGQWGSHVVILFILGALGFLVLKKVDRIDTTLTFFMVFGGLQFIRNILYLGWPMDFFAHQFTSGTLMLFAFFMITDPMTTPNNRTGRILWTIILSVIAFLMSSKMYVYSAPIWALFIMAPLTPVFDKIFGGEKYEWKSPSLTLPKGKGTFGFYWKKEEK